MSWNRTYRPRTIQDLHLLDVREQLTNLLTSPQLPHAYLFAGPKGTGKTSASRILAALFNDPVNQAEIAIRLKDGAQGKQKTLSEPSNDSVIVKRILEGHSLVVQELDAASNRGIDDVRALKERVYLLPQEGSVSVFILDEAHMLTTEASNALLKILEEPPAHVVFILATTEPHKILPTIASRCLTISFKKATQTELYKALSSILDKEKISYTQEVLEKVCDLADGSFRDGVKLIESIAAQNKSLSEASLNVFDPDISSELNQLVEAIVNKQPAQVSQVFVTIRTKGISEVVVFSKFLKLLHTHLLRSLGIQEEPSQWSTPVLQFLLQEFGQLAQNVSSPIPHLLLELKCLEIIARAQKKQAEAPATSANTHSDRGGSTSSSDQTRKADQSSAKSKQSNTVSKPIKKELESIDASDLQLGDGKTLCDRWAELVKQVATANASLAALLQSAQPITGSTGFVTIRVFYTFHREQIMNQKSQSLMQGIIRELCGGTLSLNVEVISAEQTAPAPATSGPSLEESVSESLATVASSILM